MLHEPFRLTFYCGYQHIIIPIHARTAPALLKQRQKRLALVRIASWEQKHNTVYTVQTTSHGMHAYMTLYTGM